jgi:multidrug efflux pump subunit AcrB
VLRELGAHLPRVPEVTDYQAYAGTAAPINFNGLVRQYYLRAGGEVGDLQVNLVDKHQRSAQSHAIAARCARRCSRSGAHGANVKVVEVPPGPPVLSPIVAEIYGPRPRPRAQVAKRRAQVFEHAGHRRRRRQQHRRRAAHAAVVDRRKAAMLGVPQQAIVDHAARRPRRRGRAYLHDGSKYPRRGVLQLPPSATATSTRCCSWRCAAPSGALVPPRAGDA